VNSSFTPKGHLKAMEIILKKQLIKTKIRSTVRSRPPPRSTGEMPRWDRKARRQQSAIKGLWIFAIYPFLSFHTIFHWIYPNPERVWQKLESSEKHS